MLYISKQKPTAVKYMYVLQASHEMFWFCLCYLGDRGWRWWEWWQILQTASAAWYPTHCHHTKGKHTAVWHTWCSKRTESRTGEGKVGDLFPYLVRSERSFWFCKLQFIARLSWVIYIMKRKPNQQYSCHNWEKDMELQFSRIINPCFMSYHR